MVALKILAWMWFAFWLIAFLNSLRVQHALKLHMPHLAQLVDAIKWYALWLSAAGAVVGWFA